MWGRRTGTRKNDCLEPVNNQRSYFTMGWRVVIEGCGENGHSQALLRLVRQFGPQSDSRTYGQSPKTGLCKPQQSHTALITTLPPGNLSSTPCTGLHFSYCRFKHSLFLGSQDSQGQRNQRHWRGVVNCIGALAFTSLSFLQPRGGGSWPLVFEEQPGPYFHVIQFPCGVQMCRERPNCGLDVVSIMGTQNMKVDMDWIWRKKTFVVKETMYLPFHTENI